MEATAIWHGLTYQKAWIFVTRLWEPPLLHWWWLLFLALSIIPLVLFFPSTSSCFPHISTLFLFTFVHIRRILPYSTLWTMLRVPASWDSDCDSVRCLSNFKHFAYTLILTYRHGTVFQCVSVPNDAATNCVMKSNGTSRRRLGIEAGEIAWGNEAQCIPNGWGRGYWYVAFIYIS